MPDPQHAHLRPLMNAFRLRLYRLLSRLDRLRRAIAYGSGRLSAKDAQRIFLDCEQLAGWHPLVTLTVEDTLEATSDRLAYHPELPRLAAAACARVGSKWPGSEETLYAARDWAIDLVESFAGDEKIPLVRLDDLPSMT